MRIKLEFDPYSGEYHEVLEDDEGGPDKVLSPTESWRLKKQINENNDRWFKDSHQGGED